MQFIRYRDASRAQWGVVTEAGVYPLERLTTDPPSLGAFANPSYRALVRRAVRRGTVPPVPADDVQPLAPVSRPGQIVCTALNYADHAREQDLEPPERPVLFSKSPSAVTDPGAPIVLPSAVDQVDHEVELAVVVGRTASRVDAADVDDYVAGYTVLNDVSARDALAADGQNFRGKSYPTFAPMGPVLVAGEDFDPDAADIELRVDGVTKQSSNTGELISDVAAVFEYVSHVTTLRPGDVIATGTPSGVGVHRDPPELLEPGDLVEAEIEGIGTLENPVAAE